MSGCSGKFAPGLAACYASGMDTDDTTSRGFVPTAARAMILIAQEAARLERAPHIRTTELHPDGLTESVYIDGEYMGDQPSESERRRMAK